jgi:hypothetical protein
MDNESSEHQARWIARRLRISVDRARVLAAVAFAVAVPR